MTASDPWYRDGLAFECTMCGNCCTGPPGAVWFTEDEAVGMAAAVGLDVTTFIKRYARRIGKRFSLSERLTEHGYDCVFLDRETRPGAALCKLYKARPAQCRTWPFWPENLSSPEAWASTKATTPCPGMGQGQVIPVEAITARLNRTPKD